MAFLACGIIPTFTVMASGQAGFLEELLAIATTAMLIAPGVWYLAAGYFMKKLEAWPIRISFRVAAAQAVVVGGGLVIQSFGRVRSLILPAMLAIFFLPALGALIFELRRARAAIQVLQPLGRAFQPINVIPLDAPQSPILTNSTTEPNPTNRPD